MNRGVILLRVSDRNVKAKQRFRDTANRLQAKMPEAKVLAAHVVVGAANELGLEDAVKQLINEGVADIAVVPYLVEWSYPDHLDVPDLLSDLAHEYPDVKFRLASNLGMAGDILEVVAARCEEAWSHPDMATATIHDIVEIAGHPPITPATLKDGETPSLPAHEYHILFCFGRRCMQEGGPELYQQLTRLLVERGLTEAPPVHGLGGRQRWSPEQAQATGNVRVSR